MSTREGNLEAPTRHALGCKPPTFHVKDACFTEIRRMFDICRGCRRCVSLCQAFPTLFDLVDTTIDGQAHAVKKEDYWNVVDQCYLSDLCCVVPCPYVPPHPW